MPKIITHVIIISILLSISTFSQDDSSAEEKYIKAKTLCVKQKWNDAILQFEDLLDKHSKSPYVDDAFFWVGYCLEKIPDMQTQAFIQFDYLINKFPSSPWTDDAVIHQIAIAEELVSSGKNQYKSFLLKALNSENSDIQIRAALALGRLNERSALPILKQLAHDEDFGIMAKNLIIYLSYSDTLQPQPSDTVNLKQIINLLYQKDKMKQVKKESSKQLFSKLNTQRYNQYRSMLRKDNDWTKEEISDFALWHIIDNVKFQEYIILSNEYDKKEWLRKFWKLKDPTPTTEENEVKSEFERRVIYAKEHFSALWNYSRMKYLPDQHLRAGWDHAPWDARGELYIKYGEPDIRTVEGWHTEEWQYSEYGVDFLVKQFMTNIYGNAISGGDLSRQRHGQNFSRRRDNMSMPYLESNFIYKNEMRFQYHYDAKPINNLKMNISTSDSGMTIKYTVKVNEFSSRKKNINYIEEIVVFNNDLREVLRKSYNREITDKSKSIKQKIKLNLPTGDYNFAIKIKDENSNKMGIYKSTFQIE